MASVQVNGLNARIIELVKAGVISVHIGIYESGTEVYARVVQPHPRLDVFPHQSFDLEEIETLLVKVKTSKEVIQKEKPKLSPTLTTSGLPKVTTQVRNNSTGVVVKHGEQHGEIVPTEISLGGISNILPYDSLTWKEIAFLGDRDLSKRIESVARSIGSEKAWARVTTAQHGTLTQGQDLESWWSRANALQMFTLLSTSKKAGKKPANGDTILQRLPGLAGRCPFRAYPHLEEGNEEEKEEGVSFEEQLKLFESDSN